jgi:hypothetical protein
MGRKYVGERIEGTVRLLRSAVPGLVNTGSAEMAIADDLVKVVADIAGVRGGKSDDRLKCGRLDCEPSALTQWP